MAEKRRQSMLGYTLDGRFTLEDEIGRGGMGIVYRARQFSTERYVAVKLIQPHESQVGLEGKRLLREAKMASRLNHPNIVKMIDCGIDQAGFVYLVMEYLEGEALPVILNAEGALLPQRFFDFALQLCAGLEAAHRAEMVHRDLKLSNVVVLTKKPQKDVLKILDFGLAKPLGDEAQFITQYTSAGHVVGTPLYVPPEVIQGNAFDKRGDLYALGVMFYAMTQGQLPYPKPASIAECVALIHKPIEPFRADTPPVLQNIIKRLLKKKPKDRYADIALLTASLQAAREQILGESGFIDSGTTVESVVDVSAETSAAEAQAGKRPRHLGGLAALLALLMCLGFWWFARQESPAPPARQHNQSQNRIPISENRLPKTENRETKTENRKSKTENRKPKTENRKPKTENRKPKTENRKPKTENRKPKTENRQPISEDPKPQAEEGKRRFLLPGDF